jgi:hypothetical protein
MPTIRSPHGFALRRASGWPPCWFEHGWLRDCLLTAYVWDQEIATGKGNTAGADRARYQEHVCDVVVAEVQEVAQMCRLGHVDPSQRPADADPWQPTPPPLRHQPNGGAMPLGWQVFYPADDGDHKLDQ